ncbi:MarR family winged helix-turn-helix transcriptional regulator [Amycolatopsis cihanbeyliensis]|uniref:DNA-binding MarR family transcriptional regulator n=1 Tax=Amycolatopsis cihanbeyliensis TaxID=1128664 RepID=A0A542DML1_AMYCI|nr:MarR family transcriptional regulator [Amycolatopsis cihanbeyliensis]TQJ04225.1 DNA-binding MarR family transcriptional regulator [Amycolatopsis cihanbeyliensis]
MREDSATESQSTSAGEPLIRVLTRAARVVTVRVEQLLKPEGFGLDQWLVVEALAERSGLSMADLAARTMVTGPTLTRVVDKLVSNAVVYREVDEEDRRRVRVYLSPRGRAAYKRIAAKIGKVERELLGQADTSSIISFLTTLT